MVRALACLALLACASSPAPRPAPAPAPAPKPAPPPPAAPTPESQAHEVVAQLAKGEFDAIEARFAKAQALPHGALAKGWTELVASVGPLSGCETADTKNGKDGTLVTLHCKFEKVTLPIVIGIADDGKLAGLRVLPPAVNQAPWEPPPYAPKDAVTRDVTIGELPGTLTLPAGKGPFPAIVFVHGSGPEDRDETIGATRMFADLAAGLAAHGIATLRYDKRTKVAPQTLRKEFTVEDEVTRDALAAVDVATHVPEIDGHHVYLLGHSLGGYLAPRIAQGDKAIAGLVIMAGATRPIQLLIVEQLEYIAKLDGTIDATEQVRIVEAKQAAARIAELEKGAMGNPGEQLLFAPPSYWKDLAGYQPAAVAATLKIPMLILQGEADYQVTMEDFAGWKKALAKRHDVTLHSYPKLFHAFIATDGPAKPADYERAGHVDEQVVTDLAAWINARTARR
jgi:dienelactone hydrolase